MYAPTYYTGVASPNEARAVTLGVSQEISGIDFNLQLVRTARVSGRVLGFTFSASNSFVASRSSSNDMS